MERRLRIAYIVSATTTLGIGSIAIAALNGGLFASAYASGVGVKRVEMIEEYIVVHSPTTTTSTVAVDAAAVPPDTETELVRQSAILRSKTPPATVTSSTPVVEPAAVPEAAPAGTPAPTPATPAPAKAPAPAPSVTAAPSTEPPESEPPEEEDPAPPTTVAAPPTTVRPPIPEGCREPEFRHGTWECDDD